MLRANSMKRIIASILAVMLLFGTHGILAEGLLPSFTEVAGVPMPSLGEALQCWPDNETENEDGSVTEYYNNITKDKYEKFSAYLKEQGAELADYKIEGNVLTAEIRKDGASLILHYDSGTGEATVTYPANTYDERTRNAKALFMDAEKLLNEGKPDEAYKEITAIPQYESYEPAVSLISGNENLTTAARKEKISKFEKPGNIVTFGEYEQDNDLANGSEPIEWIVLDYDAPNHRTMLISKYGLDALLYHFDWYENYQITWETCSGREWLNKVFLKSAFTEEEQEAILMTEVDNSASQSIDRWKAKNSGNNTQDKIFLLSFTEACLYFNVSEWDMDDSNVLSRVAPTPYAKAQGAEVSSKYQTAEGEQAGPWWLRTVAFSQNSAIFVNDHGSGNPGNVGMRYTVRPVLWLDLATVEDAQVKNYREESIVDVAAEEKKATYKKTGSIVTFGRYEQDNDLANGPEPIEWIVLDYDAANHRSMLISKYGLDNIIYDEWSTKRDVLWEDCMARKWLNEYFLYSAFNEEERKAIPITEVDNSESLKAKLNNKTTEVNNTQDQVFLLSVSEAMLYFSTGGFGQKNYEELKSYARARVAPTPYAIAQGAFASDKFQTLEGLPAGIWLLRTYIYDCQGASVNEGGVYADSNGELVARPVIWLDLDAVKDVLEVNSRKETEDETSEEAKAAQYARAGNIVTYGCYEQDNNLENGPEPIEWIVLTVDETNNRAMLISRYGLDNIIYDEWSTKKDVFWEDCIARKWLNQVFLYGAFNEEERKAIPITEVDNSESLKAKMNNKTTEVNNTQDRVFLLSSSEAMLYFGAGNGYGQTDYKVLEPYTRARVAPTPYAIAQGAFASDNFQTLEGLPAGIWLLRTYAYDCQGASVNEGGVYSDSSGSMVARPVIWLDLDAVNDILDVGNQKENEGEAAEEAKAAQYARVGNIVTYGMYEQDNNSENGPEPIEWIVLTVDEANHRALLVSKYGLDARNFHSERSEKLKVTWETCSLRKWLNNVFLFAAFNEDERKAILMTDVDNSDSLGLTKKQTVEVNNTQERIFVLSKSETILYFGGSEAKLRLAPTLYAIAQGAFISDQFQTIEGLPAGRWSLRTSDDEYRWSTTVFQTGAYNENKNPTGSGESNVVRPAFWLDLDAIKTAYQHGNETESGVGNLEEAERKTRIMQYTKPGNIVTYGMYEQDNDAANGPEAIEWIVLTYDEDNNRALMVSKYGLDTLQFHKDYRFGQKITWETCSAREWLNSTFLNNAFSEDEQKAIPTVELDNSDNLNPFKGQKAEANNTKDRIYLLSKSEAELYFNTEAGSRITPTAYAIAQGAIVSEKYQTIAGLPAGVWLLRTSTDSYHKVMAVNVSGILSEFKPNESENGSMAVLRPAFWLDLNAGIF